MCTTCGCGDGDTKVDGVAVVNAGEHELEHQHADGTVHTHWHLHEGGDRNAPLGMAHAHKHAGDTWHTHVHDGTTGDLLGPRNALASVHDAALPSERIVRIEQDILARNDAFADENRRAFADRGNFALNLVSSPGSGKTTLLVRTIEALRGCIPVCVIEGDQQTSLDADRIRATGAGAVQVNTGKGCHLDALMVGQALEKLGPAEGALVMIENVGNLVCPAAFDLGEAHKVVILSVTEGSDKPLKYPDMFRAADLMLINKTDLLPHVQFDVDAAVAYARRMRPELEVICLSATTGEGLDAWLAWLERGVAAANAARDRSVVVLRRRVAELEAKLTAMDASA
jgi:hydrogenase nickel incorporation protein HypB